MHVLFRLERSQVTSFAVEYSPTEFFAANDTVRIEGLTTDFPSIRSDDVGVTVGVYETDITGLQVTYLMVSNGLWMIPERFVFCSSCGSSQPLTVLPLTQGFC